MSHLRRETTGRKKTPIFKWRRFIDNGVISQDVETSLLCSDGPSSSLDAHYFGHWTYARSLVIYE